MQCPKPQPIGFGHVDSLSGLLQGYGNTSSDIIYYEVLDLPLEEFEKVKTVKVNFWHIFHRGNRGRKQGAQGEEGIP